MRIFNTLGFLIYSLAVATAPLPCAAAESWRTIQGQALYEKIQATPAGLDLAHPGLAAIRNARVEVIDPVTNALLSASQTDDSGNFEVTVPESSNSRIRVLSRLRDANVLVLNNTNGNRLYAASVDITPSDDSVVVIAHDSDRVSGAFNILEMLQEGREMVQFLDPTLVVPDITALWSPLNSPLPGGSKEGIGATYFDPSTNTISLVGDRSVDSDEFDDAVILHEFGHFVASAFSRDSSPGGVHLLGDTLDPRIAWSEGWANFFSSAVRNQPLYIDTSGQNGSSALVYDLRQNVPDGDKPGYWSEFSVDSILWDLFGDKITDSDSIAQPLSTIWSAFTELKQDYQIYLPDFLHHLLTDNPGLVSSVLPLVQSRSIAFDPTAITDVPNPFPTPFQIGTAVTGTVDSYSTQRKDLLHSSDFWTFHTTGGPLSIRMDITGLGPADDPEANDLDLFLYGMDGHVIDVSDQGLNGQAELIVETLPEEDYLVEIRSYYDRGNSAKSVFNSGTYRLIVRTPTP